jgi:GNAT superfamily N-acetyltransferase
MGTPVLRPGRPEEAEEMLDLMAAALAAETASGAIAHAFPDRQREIDWLRYLLRIGAGRVIEVDRRMAGFGITARRGSISWLVSLFVRPERQRRGLGRLLLEQLWPAGSGDRATLVDAASRAATGLYLYAGLTPRIPVLAFETDLLPAPGAAHSVRLEDDQTGVAAQVSSADEQAFGASRAEDHAHWTDRGFAFRSLWGAPGQWLGYARWSPSGRLGPVVLEARTAWPEVLDALAGELGRAGLTRLKVMAPAVNQEAVRACHALGWRYQGMEIAMATCALSGWDRCLIHRAALP